MLVIVAPGQGAQTPGFLSPWLEVPGVADRLHWLSAVAGLDLLHYGTEADADTIRDTAVAQPLLVASGLVTALALFPHPAEAFETVGAVAGHSVGELTAAAGAGVISAEQAMVLVRERGRAMAAAAAVTPTGMTAVLGGDREQVLETLSRHGLTPANDNGPGQVVAAGTVEQLEALAADPPAGARLRPLSVAGAFHTEHMAPAVEVLARYARAVTVHDPRVRLISNADGGVVTEGRAALDRIVRQVSAPVRWDLCMRTIADIGATAVIEVPPAGTLTGMIKRHVPGVTTLALKSPDDLDAARRLVEEHGGRDREEHGGRDRSGGAAEGLVVAPAAGTFRIAAAEVGTTLTPGATVGSVVSRSEEQPVAVTHGGTVVEWLVSDGDSVSTGQPLVRLQPEAASA